MDRLPCGRRQVSGGLVFPAQTREHIGDAALLEPSGRDEYFTAIDYVYDYEHERNGGGIAA